MEMQKADEIRISRALEAAETAEYAPAWTDFLTPRERILVHDAMVRQGYASSLFWYGGYRGAERAAAVFLPDWFLTKEPPAVRAGFAGAFDEAREAYFAALLTEAEPDLMEQLPIAAVEIVGSGYATLTHRDFMGALLSLGIEREVMGDIVLPEAEAPRAVAFLQKRIAPYIVGNLTKIGRDSVQVTERVTDPTLCLTRRYRSVPVVVASPRIDAIVRTLAAVSREDAVELLRSGMVERNYLPALESDIQLVPGDILSIRTVGKFCLTDSVSETRRGRIRLIFDKYD